MICEICKEEVSIRGIGTHLSIKHKLTSEEYYVKYIGSPCYCHCGKIGKFIFTTGYKNYCCRKHYLETPEYKDSNKKISASFERRDMNLWMTKRKSTNLKKYGVEYASQIEGAFEKACATQIERYGEVKNFSNKKQRAIAENAIQDNLESVNKKRRDTYWDREDRQKEALEKRKKTCTEKYGSENIFMTKETIDKIRAKFEKTERWLPIEERSEFYNYRLEVKRLTRLNVDKLFEMWDGTDYYTGLPIISSKCRKTNPSIDHKTSTYYGYINNISAEEISRLDNLCICTLSTNSKKNKKLECEFKNELYVNKKTNLFDQMVEI
jgi:hypothetical protein